jgi:hypothetical protein
MSVPDDVLKAIDEIDIEGCREQLKFALESLDVAREMMETRITKAYFAGYLKGREHINKVVDRTGNDKKKKSIAELPAYKDSRVEH